MNIVGDALLVLRTIQGLTNAANQATALFMQMRAEGRDTLTPEELASLKATNDVARQRLIDAIATAEGGA